MWKCQPMWVNSTKLNLNHLRFDQWHRAQRSTPAAAASQSLGHRKGPKAQLAPKGAVWRLHVCFTLRLSARSVSMLNISRFARLHGPLEMMLSTFLDTVSIGTASPQCQLHVMRGCGGGGAFFFLHTKFSNGWSMVHGCAATVDQSV